MKIFIIITATDVNTNINTTSVPIDINWFFDDGVTVGGQNGVPIPWSALSTATTLNAAVKAAAVQQMQDQAGYTVNLLTDQIFYIGGFIGL